MSSGATGASIESGLQMEPENIKPSESFSYKNFEVIVHITDEANDQCSKAKQMTHQTAAYM